MKFIKLEILNLASLDRQDGEVINFEEGALGNSTIFSIVGPTGSGKSTILDAICLALYNRAPRYPKEKGDKKQKIVIYGEPEDGEKNRLAPTDPQNILTRGKKNGYSKLTFIANNGTVYRAEWKVRFKTVKYETNLYLYKLSTKNGQTTEEEADWNELPAIIGLEYGQFLRTVLIAQGSFADFLTSDEDKRYELLEKLIGCKELYTNIAAKIKTEKENAVNAYNQIKSNVSAQESNIIPVEELKELQTRISELEAAEKKAKEELGKITEGLGWYQAEETFCGNISKYNLALKTAKENLDAIKDEVDRLALHDATVDAVSYYKDVKTAEGNIADCEKKLDQLSENIKEKKAQIEEEEKNLGKLKKDAEKADDELENQQPHINEARKIKVALDTARTNVEGKTSAKVKAEEAKKTAEKAVTENASDIDKAENALNTANTEFNTLLNEIEIKGNGLKDKVTQSTNAFNEENVKLEGLDATKLQEANTAAMKHKSDLKDAIRIQDNIKNNLDSQKDNKDKRERLQLRNTKIDEELKGFNIKALTDELATLNKSYTLLTSENWEMHRNDLEDGKPCPLCGSTEHPYRNHKIFAPVANKMKSLIDEKQNKLDSDKGKKQALENEQSENKGKLAGIEQTLESLGQELSKLNEEWKGIAEKHTDWPEDSDKLRGMQEEIDKNAERAAKDLKDYNELVKKVGELRRKKEDDENAERKYKEESLISKKAAEKKVTDAETALATEKAKTANLKQQSAEKAEALRLAESELTTANKDFNEKSAALKAEIGDKDPDEYEKTLSQTKENADKAVVKKNDFIGGMRQELTGLQGKESAAIGQKKSEDEKLKKSQTALDSWLTLYNRDEQHKTVTLNDIALLYSATDNWEDIRQKYNHLEREFTSADTTLKNEIDAHDKHQAKKPERTKDELNAKKVELEGRSNAELVELQARIQRHNNAQQQMGDMLEEKNTAKNLMDEWTQIADAIGGDGKTLRKIAQCYTLRFLIEHANAEIRKFNSRYELQQVKNSLGMRVIDHDRADDVRDTTSLSGGETFIISLGLALGLSSLSSRNISFENLFIDEGFGTLDPDTLATVIDSLAMLQSSQGKKVGVISHTDTMSERITTQIRIIRNGNTGSSHIEIYP